MSKVIVAVAWTACEVYLNFLVCRLEKIYPLAASKRIARGKLEWGFSSGNPLLFANILQNTVKLIS